MVGNQIFPLKIFFLLSTSYNEHKPVRERLSWKKVYSIILANNNLKWVSSQLFGCGKANLGPLGRGHLQLMFITELLLVWPVGHMVSKYLSNYFLQKKL